MPISALISIYICLYIFIYCKPNPSELCVEARLKRKKSNKFRCSSLRCRRSLPVPLLLGLHLSFFRFLIAWSSIIGLYARTYAPLQRVRGTEKDSDQRRTKKKRRQRGRKAGWSHFHLFFENATPVLFFFFRKSDFVLLLMYRWRFNFLHETLLFNPITKRVTNAFKKERKNSNSHLQTKN